jgi:uncharacterized protein involved in high-affinity Fe2+ transport
MRKGLIVLLVVLLACAVALAAGCGEKKETKSDAQKILEQSQQKMSAVDSLKMTGSMVIKTPGAETKEETVDLSMEAKMVSPEDVEGHMVMKDSSGAQTDVYMSGGYVYTNDPASGWYKQKMDAAGGVSSGMMTPKDLEELNKYAENITMTETGNEYKLSFDIGPEYFEKALGASTDQSTQTTPGSKELEEMMKSLIKGIQMSLTYTIDKSTMLAKSAKINMTMKDAPMMGDISIAMDMAFSDYNAPVQVALPEEAKSAKEVEPGTAMPTIPGLGI